MSNEEEESGEEEESEEEEEGEEEDSKEEEEGNSEKENPSISKNIIEMGNCLYNLLHNIHKVPTPPPTNNNNIISKHQYKEVLISHLNKINTIDMFSKNKNIFTNVDYYNRNYFQRSSLSFILNSKKEEVEVVESGDNNQEMARVYNVSEHHIIINPDDPLINQVITDIFSNPGSLLILSLDKFEIKKKSTCTILTNIILYIYELSLKDQINSKIMRRCQF
ncbi:hypothetical protein C1645_860089, partial [Glomus cerebriforme]